MTEHRIFFFAESPGHFRFDGEFEIFLFDFHLGDARPGDEFDEVLNFRQFHVGVVLRGKGSSGLVNGVNLRCHMPT